MADIEVFRNHIIESGYVMDPEGTHHEFVSGMHGQKLDFDNIEDESPLYKEWIDVAHGFIAEQYGFAPEVILGVANGTNRVALDTARRFDGESIGLKSKKDPNNSKVLSLNDFASRVVVALRPNLAVVIEDVGTTGSNSVQVAVEAQKAGAKHVEVVTTWKRRTVLERLQEAGIVYRAMIDEPLTTYEPEACLRDPDGFCYRGWEFIERPKE